MDEVTETQAMILSDQSNLFLISSKSQRKSLCQVYINGRLPKNNSSMMYLRLRLRMNEGRICFLINKCIDQMMNSR